MIKKILIIFIVSISITRGQDSVAVSDTSFNLDPGPILLKSILFPGIGQVSQERLWESVFFYGMSLNYYYQAALAYHNYQQSSKKKYLNRFRNKISMAAFIHLLNIIDAYDSAYRQNVKGWDGTMFSDKPIKSPWGATVRSLFFPGWGQWYNEKYVKSFVYLGIVSYVGYEIYQNNQDYKDVERNIRQINDLPADQQDAALLKKYKKDSRDFIDSRSRYSWYFGLAYLVMLTDAHVDAHLFKFDETIDITVPVSSYDGTPLIGLTITF